MADKTRGVRHLLRWLGDMREQGGIDRVLLEHPTKSLGRLLRKGQPRPRGGVVVPIAEIEAAVRYSEADDYFVVGDFAVRQKRGWPQGHAISEPATLAESGWYIRRLYQNVRRLRRLGFCWGSLSADQMFAGLLHVDDLLLASGLFCGQCMQVLLNRCFPQDFQWGAEEEGDSVRFLHTVVVAGERSMQAFPYMPNVPFGLGVQPWPTVSRCPPFLGPRRTPRASLRQWLHPQLRAFNAPLAYMRPKKYRCYVAALFMEVLFSGWDVRSITATVCEVAPRHDSRFWAVVRQLAPRLRHADAWRLLHDWARRLLTAGLEELWADELADGREEAARRCHGAGRGPGEGAGRAAP